MMHRTVAVLLATVACSATAVAQGLGYAPHNAKYSITSKIHTVQEVMGQRTEVDASSEQQVTVAAIATAAGLFDYSATIDSLAVTNSAGPPTDVSTADRSYNREEIPWQEGAHDCVEDADADFYRDLFRTLRENAPHVIPPYTSCRFRVRGTDAAYCEELVRRVVACAEAFLRRMCHAPPGHVTILR